MPKFWGVKLTDPPKLRCQRGIEPAAEDDSTKKDWLETESEPGQNAMVVRLFMGVTVARSEADDRGER